MVLVFALLFAFGAPDALAQGGGSCSNEQAAYNCSDDPVYLVPGLADLNGWKLRAHYRNILFGDIDGDRIDEMVARGRGGVQTYRFDRSIGQWRPIAVNQILPDNQGWGARPYYDTIRLGDINGDGTAELIARAVSGIIVYRFGYSASDKSVGGWTQLTTSGPMADADCFDPGKENCWNSDPSYYSTIQLSPLGRAGATPTMQLIGRSGRGLEMYKWNEAAKKWFPLETLPFLSDDNIGQDPQWYSNILPWDTTTLVARSLAGLQVFKWSRPTDSAPLGKWTQQKTSGSPVFRGNRTRAQYGTLQPFRGTGSATTPTILGRNSQGVKLFQYTGSGWKGITGGSSFPFADGANGAELEPQYYRTLQAADIDGDGVDEFIGRGVGGMIAFEYDAKADSWDQIGTTLRPALTDDPWADPAYYTTIKTAHLDSKTPARSLIARGPHGVRAWLFDKGRWTRYKLYGFPAFSASQQIAYDRLSRRVLKIDAAGGIRAQYDNLSTSLDPNNDVAGTCSTKISFSPDQYKTCNPPSQVGPGISGADWTAVANQVIEEIYYANETRKYFANVQTVNSQIAKDQNGQFATIQGDLALDKSEANAVTTEVSYLDLFEGFADILAEIDGAGEFLGVVGGALGVASSSTTSASDPTKYDKTFAEIQSQISQIQSDTRTATTTQEAYVLNDLGLMTTVGAMNAGGLWTVDLNQQNAAASAARQSFAGFLYRAFIPTLWRSWTVSKCYPDDYCPGESQALTYYGDPYTYGSYSPVRDFSGLIKNFNPCGSFTCAWPGLQNGPYAGLLSKLMSSVQNTCKFNKDTGANWSFPDCNLGFTASEVQNSWGVPRSRCDYFDESGGKNDCWFQGPFTTMTGDARGVGARSGAVDMSIVAPLKRDLDMRRGKVTLGRLLDEEGGGQELVNFRSGKNLTPRTLRLKRGARRHAAAFETRRGRSPRIRGVLTVVERKVRVRRGRRVRVRKARTLQVRLRVGRAAIERPRRCDARGLTRLGVHLVVRGRRGRPAQVLGAQPWECRKGGHMRFRASRSAARVSAARAAVRGRVASIPLRCRRLSGEPKPCKGTLALRARLGGRRPVVVGHGRFSIRARRALSARVRLSARAHRALAHSGRLWISARVGTRHPSGARFIRGRRLLLVRR